MIPVTNVKARSLERFTMNWAAQNNMSIQSAVVELFEILGITLASNDMVAFTEVVDAIKKGTK